MTKAETMDKLIEAEDHIGSSVIFTIVRQLFHYDLESTPVLPGDLQPRAAMDVFLAQREGQVTGGELRSMINGTFGVNLNALSALEGKRVSLFSKGQWMLQADNDLFVVYTGTGDVDVTIYSTGYFADLSGSRALPGELVEALTSMGYADDGPAGCSYANPAGEAVPDAFKGQTIMALMNVIRQSYANT